MKKSLIQMISAVKNAQTAGKLMIFIKKTKTCNQMLNILWDEGLILGFKNSNIFNNYIEIFLKYRNKNKIIRNIKILFIKNTKINFSLKQLWKIKSNTSNIFVLTTTKGFLTLDKCKINKVGGIPYVFIN